MKVGIAFSASALLLVVTLLAGCGRGGKARERDVTEDRLYKIGKAYIQACYDLERAPESFGEIKPFIEGETSDDMVVSPNDGQPFVILWGVDFARLPPGKEDPFTVGGYEKHGKDGMRYVLRFPIRVGKMTEEEFQRAVFPSGWKR